MKVKFSAPRGTKDILPLNFEIFNKITKTAALVCKRFGFLRIETPTFENVELFKTSV